MCIKRNISMHFIRDWRIDMEEKKQYHINYLKILESTSLISYLTALLYFFPYTFKAGYYSYFNIPEYYRNLDLKTSIDSSYSIFVYILIVLIFMSLTFSLGQQIENGIDYAISSTKKVKSVT